MDAIKICYSLLRPDCKSYYAVMWNFKTVALVGIEFLLFIFLDGCDLKFHRISLTIETHFGRLEI